MIALVGIIFVITAGGNVMFILLMGYQARTTVNSAGHSANPGDRVDRRNVFFLSMWQEDFIFICPFVVIGDQQSKNYARPQFICFLPRKTDRKLIKSVC